MIDAAPVMQPCCAYPIRPSLARRESLSRGGGPPILSTMRRQTSDPVFAAEPDPPLRGCDRPGCAAGGEFRAPKSRLELERYYWFCLEHVRAYNTAWNYYAGMSETEIEAEIRYDTVWQRPTWKLGERHSPTHGERVRDPFGFYNGKTHHEGGRRGNGRANGHGSEAAARAMPPRSAFEPPPIETAPAHPILSRTTVNAVESAFNTLANTVLSNNARTLEDLVKEMLRPMLKSWLDDNLPGLVERIVKAEIERVSRGR